MNLVTSLWDFTSSVCYYLTGMVSCWNFISSEYESTLVQYYFPLIIRILCIICNIYCSTVQSFTFTAWLNIMVLIHIYDNIIFSSLCTLHWNSIKSKGLIIVFLIYGKVWMYFTLSLADYIVISVSVHLFALSLSNENNVYIFSNNFISIVI